MREYIPFYKVVVLKIDVFESSIIDEKHFSSQSEATAYADTMRQGGYITVIATM